MSQAIPKLLTFEDFLEWKPENGRYELHDKVIVEMQPTGKHEEIAGFLSMELVFFGETEKYFLLLPKKSSSQSTR